MKHLLTAGALALAAFAAAPAMAVAPVTPGACDVNDVDFGGVVAVSCQGYFAGNILSGNPGDLLAQKNALAVLGLNWNTADWPTVDANKDNNGNAFGEFGTMFGATYVGIHYGAGQVGPGVGIRGGVTAIYKLVLGSPTTKFDINEGAVSSVTLYGTETPPGDVVPEPATWAMLIAGFGLVGATMRRRRGAAHVSA